MKYSLDNQNEPYYSIIFWITKFAVNKIYTTSHRLVQNPKIVKELILKIDNSSSLAEVNHYFKELRGHGYQGLHIYHKPLSKFGTFVKDNRIKSLKEIDNQYLHRFLSESTLGMSNASKKNYRVTITNFFNYIDAYNEDDKANTHNFSFDLRIWERNSISPKANVPDFMNDDELKEFFKALESYKKTSYPAYRNSFIIKLLLLTGLRSREVIDLKYEDMIEDSEYYKFQVIGKGNKYRDVIIKKEFMEEYIINDKKYKDEELIFRNMKAGKLSQAYISDSVARVLRLANIKKNKKGSHLLRHTFATQLYKQEKDVFLLKEALGHADINTSMIYTHLNNDELKKTTSIMDHLIN